MRTLKILLISILFTIGVLLSLSGCGSKESIDSQLVGSWYLDGDASPSMILYDDGTCELTNEYGTCTWSIVNNNQLKIINFYGELKTLKISSLKDGCLILEDDIILWNVPMDDATEVVNETSISILNATPFSEGIAWVKYVSSDGVEQTGWLHTDGSINHPFPVDIVSSLLGSTQLGSNFSGGYSYITGEDDYISGRHSIPDSFIILDREGNISAQSPNDGNSYNILCGGDGVYLVKQSIRSMTENEDRYGFIAADGTWIYECASCIAGGTHPLSLDVTPEEQHISYSYLGEGIFQATYHNGREEGSSHFHRYGIVLYNAYTKKSFIVDSTESYARDGDIAYTIGNFSMGWIPIKDGNDVYMLSSNFEKNSLNVSGSDKIIYKDGILFSANSAVDGRVKWVDGKFYKIDGSILFDMSSYVLVADESLYAFYNGYAIVHIYGSDGRKYVGIVDSNGNFVSEPECGSVVPFSEGVYIFHSDSGEKRVINNSGETSPFSWDSKHLYFVDPDGNVLNPYLVK